MKKLINKIFVYISILSSIVLSSCAFFGETEEKKARRLTDEFISLLDNQDKDEIKNIFAKEKIDSIETFDDDLDQLLVYYKGESTSKVMQRSNSGASVDYDERTRFLDISCDVTTDIDVYRMFFIWYYVYSTNKNLIGIWSFYIIRFDDDTTKEYAYGGDGFQTPGINIGKVWSYDDRFE